MPVLEKSNITLQKYLLFARRIPNIYQQNYSESDNSYLCSYLCLQTMGKTNQSSNGLPFTIIADEATDLHASQFIHAVCLRYVELKAPKNPQIRNNIINLERVNASTISETILKSILHTSISLDASNIRGQDMAELLYVF